MIDHPEKPARPRPRRGLRLTLGAMMISVLILGGGMGWIAYRIRVQRQAVATIIQAGGSVLYDYQVSPGKVDMKATPKGPKWLRNSLGPELFDAVVFVGFGSRVTL